MRPRGHELTSGTPSRPRLPRRSAILLVALLAVVGGATAVTYWPGLSAQALTLDDSAYLNENFLIQNPSWTSVQRFLTEVLSPSTVAGYYHPLALISLMIDHALGGSVTNLRPFHCTSLILHVLNTLLVLIIVYQLFGSPWLAAVAALLFGTHPMNAERVAWVADRKTVLSALFALGCLACYIRYTRGPRATWYVSALLLFALSLLSKPALTALPVLLLILDWWPLNRIGRRAVWEKIPFLALAGMSMAITAISEARGTSAFFPSQVGPGTFILVLCHNVVFYLGKIVWPVQLSPWYPFPPALNLTEPSVLSGVIGTTVLMAIAVLSLRWTRAVCAGALFFLCGFVPSVGAAVRVADMIAADRFIYVPVVGLLLVLACGLKRCWTARRPPLLTAWPVTIVLVAAIVVGLEIRGSQLALARWRDSLTLYQYMATCAPNAPKVHNGFGAALLERGQVEQAEVHFRTALRLAPSDAGAHNNLALVLETQGKRDEAAAHYTKALEFAPDLAETHNNLGLLLAQRGRDDQAADHYRQALKSRPDYPAAHRNLAALLARQGQIDPAIAEYRQALLLQPQAPDVHKDLAIVLAQAGRVGDAAAHYEQALRFRPKWVLVLNNLAWILATDSTPGIGDPPRAVGLALTACELTRYERADVLDTLAAAYAAAGQLPEAVQTAERAMGVADASEQVTLAREIKARLARYQAALPDHKESHTRPTAAP